MNLFQSLSGKVIAFLYARGENAIERHRIIVYFLHSLLVLIVILMHFLGLGGSQEFIPLCMSGIHGTVCLLSLYLYISRRLSLSVAFSTVALTAQCTIVIRMVFFMTNRPDHFLQLILVNQITSLLAVVFLVMCFIKYTPVIITIVSLTNYAYVISYLHEPGLQRTFFYFLSIHFFLCLLGELLRRNVTHVQADNTQLHNRETRLMQIMRLKQDEIEAYLRICSYKDPSATDVDRMFAMLTPSSQYNLITAVRQHLKGKLNDKHKLERAFPELTKTETDVCRLILEGKKRGEICVLLSKSEKNIDVVRTHVRKKLNVPSNRDLKEFLEERTLNI